MPQLGLSCKALLEGMPGMAGLMAAPGTAAQLLQRQLAIAAHWHGAAAYASGDAQSQQVLRTLTCNI